MDTLDDIVEYAPSPTLRAVASSALEQVGRTWNDVRGVAILLSDFDLPFDLFDQQSGLVHADRLDDALDHDVSGYEHPWPWGGFQGDLYRRFEMTIWLDDRVLRFEPRYLACDYIECRSIPVEPPLAYSYSVGSKDSRRP